MTCRISRLAGRLTTRAPSRTRLTSSGVMGRCRSGMATIPRLFSDWMWLPAMPTCAERMRVALDRSAFSTEARIDSLASRMLSTMPRLRPPAGATPTPRMRISPSAAVSATRVQILVVPTSMEAKVLPLAATSVAPSSQRSPLLVGDPPAEAKVHGADLHSLLPCPFKQRAQRRHLVVEVAAVAEGGAQAPLEDGGQAVALAVLHGCHRQSQAFGRRLRELAGQVHRVGVHLVAGLQLLGGAQVADDGRALVREEALQHEAVLVDDVALAHGLPEPPRAPLLDDDAHAPGPGPLEGDAP